jgi:hypothetical protein
MKFLIPIMLVDRTLQDLSFLQCILRICRHLSKEWSLVYPHKKLSYIAHSLTHPCYPLQCHQQVWPRICFHLRVCTLPTQLHIHGREIGMCCTRIYWDACNTSEQGKGHCLGGMVLCNNIKVNLPCEYININTQTNASQDKWIKINMQYTQISIVERSSLGYKFL